MKPTDAKLIPALQSLYADEVKAENQYYSHEATFRNRGLVKLADQKKEQAGDEGKHREALGGRLAFFGAAPLAFAGKIDVATGAEMDCEEMIAAEKALEVGAVEKYNAAYKLACEVGDMDTADLLLKNLKDETEHVHEAEVSEGLIELIGLDNFLQAMIN